MPTTSETLVTTLLFVLMFKEPLKVLIPALFNGVYKLTSTLSRKAQLNVEYAVTSVLVCVLSALLYGINESVGVMFFGAAELIVTLIYGVMWQNTSHKAKKEDQNTVPLSLDQVRLAQLHAEYGIEQAQAAKVNAGR